MQTLISCASAASLQDVVPVLELPAPPDGGWGWVIVFASFMCNLIIDGIAYSFGVILPPLVKHFDSNRSSVSWVGSLLCGLYMGSGPVVGGLVNKFGCRTVCIAGGIISCLSMLLSTLSVNVYMLMATYGFLGGFGLGLVYLPAVITCGYYFEKKRALATGISVCGSGVGCFVMAPVANALLEEYGWKGANIIFAGLCLNCCVFGALMRPLELAVREVPPPNKGQQQQTDVQIKRGSISNAGQIPPQAGPLGLPHISSVLRNSHASMSLLQEHIEEESEDEGTNDEEDDDRFEDDAGPPTMTAGSNSLSPAKSGSKRRRTISELANNRSSSASGPAGRGSDGGGGGAGSGGGANVLRVKTNPNFRRNVSTPGFGRLAKLTGLDGPPEAGREHIFYGINDGTEVTLQPSRRNSQAIVRPMSRKDIFYSGSVVHLALEQEPTTPPPQILSRYRHSVITIPRGESRLSMPRGSIVASHLEIRREAIDPELLSLKLNSSNALLSVLKEMVDLSLFLNPKFVLICLSNILGFLALYVPYVYLPTMITAKGISMGEASFIVSAIGISNTIGRVVFGWLVDLPWVSSLIVTNISLVCSGLCVLVFPACNSFASFITLALCLGLSVSAYISLTSIILVDLLGLDVLTSAFGLLVSFRGVASILGPPLAGFVFEATDDVNAAFYMAGTFFIVGGIISQIAYFLQKSSRKNK